jgi:eukaryotic-like serine/threonine-protein kinase
MRAGEVIKGYYIVTEPTNSGGGMCMWTFAAKDRREYFLKEFLQPKWPAPGSMGSEAGKERRRANCYEFEGRHKEIMRRLADATITPGGGNLVTAVDFFRFDTTYYKVTEKIVTASLSSLRALSVHERAVIFRTLVLSLQMLHRQDIVHGDLKPSNVLIQKGGSGLHTAKLIDFDDSYLSGMPPPRDQIVGDSIYGAPEWFGYTKKDSTMPASALTRAADIFALGLLFHHYLTGSLPGRASARYWAPGQAVIAGEQLLIDGRLSPGLTALLKRMVAPAPGDRPTVEEIFGELEADDLLTVRGPTRSGRLRINMGRSASPAPDDEPREERGEEPGEEPLEEGGEEPGEEPLEEPSGERDEELSEEPLEEPSGERDEELGEERGEGPDERDGTGASPSRVRIHMRNKDEGATDDSDR